MEHPLAKGTKVLAAYSGCQTCAPNFIQKVDTRIRSVREEDGVYFYTLLDGREVSEFDIIEVR